MENEAQKTRYKKRPIWQWILIYFVIAGILYGLVYYFININKASRGINYYRRPPNQTHSPLPNQTTTILLAEKNNSGESGSAIFKQDNGVFTLTILLKGKKSNAPQPAAVYEGTCKNKGTIKYILNPSNNGSSITSLQISLDQLKKQQPLAITVTKSKEESTHAIVCGDLHL